MSQKSEVILLYKSKKKLNKQFPGVRDGRHRWDVINEIVRIFQGVENFMEIQVWRGNGKTHYTSFCKIRIMIIRPATRSNGKKMHFLLYNDSRPS